jgi:hypothetical protein
MDPEQATPVHLMGDAVVIAPEGQELAARDVPVLFGGQRSDGVPSFWTQIGVS